MNDHDFGDWSDHDLALVIYALSRPRDGMSGDAMSWSPRWQDRTGDAAPMRSHL